jgi:hypothetical protein
MPRGRSGPVRQLIDTARQDPEESCGPGGGEVHAPAAPARSHIEELLEHGPEVEVATDESRSAFSQTETQTETPVYTHTHKHTISRSARCAFPPMACSR